MRCTVVWALDAEDQLADIWLASPNRNAVTVAAHSIDTELAQDPLSKARLLHEGLYTFAAPPLRVVFSFEEADRLVKIVRITTDESPPATPPTNGQVFPSA